MHSSFGYLLQWSVLCWVPSCEGLENLNIALRKNNFLIGDWSKFLKNYSLSLKDWPRSQAHTVLKSNRIMYQQKIKTHANLRSLFFNQSKTPIPWFIVYKCMEPINFAGNLDLDLDPGIFINHCECILKHFCQTSEEIWKKKIDLDEVSDLVDWNMFSYLTVVTYFI